jgi:hypothetical protein
MITFYWGVLTMSCWVAGLFFLRFWRDTGDRLFALFSAAFWVLSIHWISLAVIGATDSTRAYFYLMRLVAFLLILAAIVDKNRSDR